MAYLLATAQAIIERTNGGLVLPHFGPVKVKKAMKRKIGPYTRYNDRWIKHDEGGLVIYREDPSPTVVGEQVLNTFGWQCTLVYIDMSLCRHGIHAAPCMFAIAGCARPSSWRYNPEAEPSADAEPSIRDACGKMLAFDALACTLGHHRVNADMLSRVANGLG